jgi:hypothetical protein
MVLTCSLMVAFDNDLTRDIVSSLFASRVMRVHLDTTAGSRRQRLHQIHVNLRIAGSHEGEGNQSSTPQVLTNEAVDGFTVFEAAKQRRKTIGLIVQGEHCLMHKRKSGTASLS